VFIGVYRWFSLENLRNLRNLRMNQGEERLTVSGKRIFDLFFSIPGLVILSPLFVVMALAVKLGPSGPVFHRSKRVGRHGRTFRLLKFRTMERDAQRQGPKITVDGDPRITKIGAIMRRLKIDELPQLINVVRGQMSLVGPRPEDPEYVALYTPEQRKVLDLMPGITDPASIKYALESELLGSSADPLEDYVNDVMPDKIRMNLEYASRATVWNDFETILKTIFTLSKSRTRARRKQRRSEKAQAQASD
jgi:lipopolysaccharide/colanic/teichoic acid biosynthesis glycosyltransferase